jgi:hypothetical protein
MYDTAELPAAVATDPTAAAVIPVAMKIAVSMNPNAASKPACFARRRCRRGRGLRLRTFRRSAARSRCRRARGVTGLLTSVP